MIEPELAERSQVTLLVPHPARIAVLVADSSSETSTSTMLQPQPRLPMLWMNSAEPSLPEILASIDVVDTSKRRPCASS